MPAEASATGPGPLAGAPAQDEWRWVGWQQRAEGKRGADPLQSFRTEETPSWAGASGGTQHRSRAAALAGASMVLPEGDELSSKAKIKRNYDNKTSKREKLSARVSSFPDRKGGGCLVGAHVPQTWR